MNLVYTALANTDIKSDHTFVLCTESYRLLKPTEGYLMIKEESIFQGVSSYRGVLMHR